MDAIVNIKSNLAIGTTENNTILSLEEGAITDRNDLPNLIDRTVANNVIRDTSPASMIEFSLDMNIGVVSLTFNDVINSSVVDFTGLRFQNSEILTLLSEMVVLSNGQIVNSSGFVIDIQIIASELIIIKSNLNLATNNDNTYLYVHDFAFIDTSSQNVIEDTLQVTNLFPDVTPPVLLNFTLNFDSDTLVLTFDEPMNISLLNAAGFVIQNAPTSPSQSVSLGGSVGINANTLLTEISVYLNQSDVNLIKLNEFLATSLENTYLTFDNGSAADVSSNFLVGNATGIRAAIFFSDVTPPQLASFNLYDHNEGFMVLQFTEPVNTSSIDITGFIFQSDFFVQPSLLSQRSYQLTQSSCNRTYDCMNGFIITIYIGPDDLNAIKLNDYICTSTTNCVPQLESSFINDMAGVGISTQPNAATNLPARLLRSFTKDTTNPTLEFFELDLDTNTLILNFSEPIIIKYFNVTGITLQSSLTNGDQLTLSFSTTSGENGLVVSVNLNEDVDILKAAAGFATNTSNTYLYLESYTTFDLSTDRNFVEQIFSNNALQASNVIPDTSPPVVVRFSLDLNRNKLTIDFSEPIKATQIDLSQLILGDSDSQTPTTSITLNGTLLTSNQTSLTDGLLSVCLFIDDTTLSSIKSDSEIGTRVANTYLVITSGAFLDMNDQTNIDHQAPSIQVISDQTLTEVTGFSLDLNLGLLQLSFSDVINASSAKITSLSLQDAALATSRVPLSGGTVTQSTALSITFLLTGEDILALKSNPNVATSNSTTYLIMRADAFSDISNLDILLIPDGSALVASTFISDESTPNFINFTLNMNTGILSITYDEPVDLGSVNVSLITVTNTTTSDNTNLTLTGYSTLEFYSSNTVFAITLTSSDLNTIKADQTIGNSQYNTYLHLLPGTVTDVFGNPNSLTSTGIGAFIPDSTGPKLVSFLSINIDVGTIQFEFDEPVLVSSITPSRFTLQDDFFNNYTDQLSFYNLESTAICNVTQGCIDNTIIGFALDSQDLSNLKERLSVCTVRTNCVPVFEPSFITDMASVPNLLIAVPNGRTNLDERLLQEFLSDTSNPTLDSFSLNLILDTLTLTFNEPVEVASIQVSNIVLQSSASGGVNLTLSSSTPRGSVSNIVVFDLNADAPLIKAADFASSRSNTFLSIQAGTAFDVALIPNSLIAIPSNAALQVTEFITDFISPLLQSFELNLNLNQLRLTFNERIKGAELNLTRFRLQEASSSPNFATIPYGTLTDMSGQPVINDIEIIYVNLLQEPALSLKTNSDFGTLPNNTFLQFENASFEDLIGIPNVENISQASDVTPDETKASIESFTLSVNTAQLFNCDDVVPNWYIYWHKSQMRGQQGISF